MKRNGAIQPTTRRKLSLNRFKSNRGDRINKQGLKNGYCKYTPRVQKKAQEDTGGKM